MIFRVDKDKPADSADKSLFQLAASWQLNSYLLLKVSCCLFMKYWHPFGIPIKFKKMEMFYKFRGTVIMVQRFKTSQFIEDL